MVRQLLDTHDKHMNNPLDGLNAQVKDKLVAVAAQRRGDGKITYTDFFAALMSDTDAPQPAPACCAAEGTELLQIVLVTRHGARFPLKRCAGVVACSRGSGGEVVAWQ